jgi:hypothetical protein
VLGRHPAAAGAAAVSPAHSCHSVLLLLMLLLFELCTLQEDTFRTINRTNLLRIAGATQCSLLTECHRRFIIRTEDEAQGVIGYQ